MQSVVSNNVRSGPDTWDAWQDTVCRTYVPVHCKADDRSSFRAELGVASLGKSVLTRVNSSPVHYSRTVEDIRATTATNNGDGYLICTMLAGENQFRQSGRTTIIGKGDICVFDTAKPYLLECPKPYESVLLMVDRARFESRLPNVEQLAARRVPASGPYTQIAGGMLRSTAKCVSEEGQDGERLLTALLDVISLALDDTFAELDHGGPRRAGIVGKAKAFTRARLFDPEFKPSEVAKAIGVSPRTLSRSFAQQGETLTRWMWNQRLEAARDMLMHQTAQSVSEVALNCGFNDFSHFSRTFKRAYGLSPSELRKRH